MKRFTLLEIVQQVGESVNIDRIRGLNETTDTKRITQSAIECLSDICNRRLWSWRQHRIVKPIKVAGKLVTFDLPDNVDSLTEVRYKNGNGKFDLIEFMPTANFLSITSQDTADIKDTETLDGYSDSEIYIANNQRPRYYTQFVEGLIILDGYYKAEQPSGLVEEDFQITCTTQVDVSGVKKYGVYDPDWVPSELPTRFFLYWLHETKAAASMRILNKANARAERESLRLYNLLLRQEPINSEDEYKGVNYGQAHRY